MTTFSLQEVRRLVKIIMQEAAKNLSTVTLELGGKSPIIVDDTADLKDAIEKVSWGKFFNAGQTCVAPDYMLVHRNHYSKALDLFKEQIAGFYGEESLDHQSSRDYARVINTPHFKRLREWVSEARDQGAKVVTGGIFDVDDRYISPTIMTGRIPGFNDYERRNFRSGFARFPIRQSG